MSPKFAPSVLLQTPRLSRLGLLLGATALTTLSHAQAIYSITEQAGPSETLSVRGDSLANDTTYKVYPYGPDGTRGAAVACPTSSSNGAIALFRLPSTISASVYEVVASTSKGTSNSMFVNRPRMEWSDVPDAMQNGLVRVVGRNFKPNANVAPTVTLYNTSTRVSYVATIDTATDNDVSFHVPGNVPAGSYKILLNNNLAGSASQDPNPLALTVKAQASDPFALGVSWGADYAGIAGRVLNAKTSPGLPTHVIGDGTSDDTVNLQALLWWVQQTGGGTVYLPAGRYRVDGGQTNITVPNNVVLTGAGKGQTVLQVGYRFNASTSPDSEYAIALWTQNQTGLNGISNLTIENLNASPRPSYVLRGGPVGQYASKFFLKSVEVKLNNGQSIALMWPKKAVVADCDISSTSWVGPIYSPNSTELQFLRNNVNYRGGRVAFGFSQRSVFEDNTIQFDNAYHSPGWVETGGIELSYGQQILLHRNNLGGYGPVATAPPGDGEIVLTQFSNLGEFAYVGTVKSASGRLLTPQANWPTTPWINSGNGSLARKYVSIVSGKGAGQWRWITAYSSSMMMVDRNWQVTPDSTSRYEIQSMNCYQETMTDNNVYGGTMGIELYDGAFDTIVSRNVLTNTGQLIVRSSCSSGDQMGNSASNYVVGNAWDVSVIGNTVTDTNGAQPGCIAVAALDAAGLNWAQMITNVDVRRNTVTGVNLPPRPYQTAQTDGIEVSTVYVSGLCFDSTSNAGTIIQSNTVARGKVVNFFTAFGDLNNDMVSN